MLLQRWVIEIINQWISILDLVALFTDIKNYKNPILCPFHEEKTPSFYIREKTQWFNCFGCGIKGDSITFIMKIKWLSFIDSLRWFEKKFRLILCSKKIRSNTIKKDAYYEIIKSIQTMYTKSLTYIKYQNIIKKFIDEWQLSFNVLYDCNIGFHSGNTLNRYFKDNDDQNSLHINKYLHLGLIKIRDDKIQDIIPEESIVFPIKNIKFQQVSFAYKTLKNNSNFPKYLNLHTSNLFQKRYCFFNPHIDKKIDQCIIVEGYIDALQLHQHKIKNVFCIMNNYISNELVWFFYQNFKTIVLFLDQDRAGILGTIKNYIRLKYASNHRTNIYCFLDIHTTYKDPDEWICNTSSKTFDIHLKTINDWLKMLFIHHKIDQYTYFDYCVYLYKYASSIDKLRIVEWYRKTLSLTRSKAIKLFWDRSKELHHSFNIDVWSLKDDVHHHKRYFLKNMIINHTRRLNIDTVEFIKTFNHTEIDQCNVYLKMLIQDRVSYLGHILFYRRIFRHLHHTNRKYDILMIWNSIKNRWNYIVWLKKLYKIKKQLV